MSTAASKPFGKFTATSKNSKFIFLGNEYSYDILQKNRRIKTYYDKPDYEAHLEQDIYGRLILYCHNKNNNGQCANFLWLFVEDDGDVQGEAAADEDAKIIRDPDFMEFELRNDMSGTSYITECGATEFVATTPSSQQTKIWAC